MDMGLKYGNGQLAYGSSLKRKLMRTPTGRLMIQFCSVRTNCICVLRRKEKCGYKMVSDTSAQSSYQKALISVHVRGVPCWRLGLRAPRLCQRRQGQEKQVRGTGWPQAGESRLRALGGD